MYNFCVSATVLSIQKQCFYFNGTYDFKRHTFNFPDTRVFFVRNRILYIRAFREDFFMEFNYDRTRSKYKRNCNYIYNCCFVTDLLFCYSRPCSGACPAHEYRVVGKTEHVRTMRLDVYTRPDNCCAGCSAGKRTVYTISALDGNRDFRAHVKSAKVPG